MLKILRKKGVMRKILWVLAVVIIFAFGFFGQAYLMNSNRGRGPTYAGRIFGRTVSLEEFQEQFQQTHIQVVMKYGQNLHKVLPYLDLQSQTWDRLIALHEAGKRKIRISDAEVIKAIQEDPFFVKDGVFNREIYNNVLQAFRVTPRQFEEGVRDSLKIERLIEQATSDIKATDEEAFEVFKQENEKVQVSYVIFPVEKHKDRVVFDEDAAKAYFEKHRNEFVLPPMIKIDYIKIKYPENATEDDKDAVMEKTLDIFKKLGLSPDLPRAAKEHNLMLETSGFFSMENPVLKDGWSLALIQQLFQQPVGFLADPVETAEGFEILKIADRKEAHVPDYQEARQQAREAWIKSEAGQLARAEARTYLDKIRTGSPEGEGRPAPDFNQTAKDAGLEVGQTPVFSRGQYLPKIGIAGNFQDAAFALDEDNPVSGVVETERGFAVLHLDSRIPVDMEKFQQMKPEVAQQVLARKSAVGFSDFLARLRVKANLEDNISKLMEEQKEDNHRQSGQGRQGY